jgi:hypothetical protein
MDHLLTRRQLIGGAILAGAGATVAQSLSPVGRFDPAQAATDPDSDPNFLMGQVVSYDAASGALQVVDLDLQVRAARLGSASQVWKQGLWNSVPVSLNDCIMSRGALDSQNTLQVDQLYVGIQSFKGQLASVSSSSVSLTQPGGSVISAAVTGVTQVNAGGQTVTGSVSGLATGQYVVLVGYGDPSAGSLVATLIVAPAADAGTDPAPVVVSSGLACTTTTYGFLATFFCCGNVSSACGKNCAGSGSGACGDCRADKHHMAWPHLSTTGCNVTCDSSCTPPGTTFCCRTVGKLACGNSVSLHNPCLNKSVTATVHDCGPCVHCISPFGCHNRQAVVFDLTPCTFTALGGTLSSGIQTCNATACVS